MKRRYFLSLPAALLISAGNVHAQGERFPSRPIQVISTASPGSQSDTLLRFLAAEAGKALGQPLVVVSKPSAAGTIGADQAKRAPPDGHTLIFGGNTVMAANVHLIKNLGYDPVRDFEAITLVTTNPLVLVVRSSLPVKTLPEFIAYAKTRPGQLNYGVGNAGNKVAVGLLESLTGIKTVEIGFKGASDAMSELIAERLDFYVSDPLIADPFLKQGSIRALAVTAPVRLPSMRALPTMPEAGVPGYQAITTFLGFYAPRGTPKTAITALHDAFVQAITSPQGQEQFVKMGMVAKTSSPEELAAFTREQIAIWAQLVKVSGMQAQ
ncbi:tripartite tricarboxylate transporter substrate binding protein [Variovorax rhizosphaerae]|uniref:Tripartite tricarboxylate transporter substrate binding protein n=1 Tax=Variovorax rhizosphaerae TaxID=1836200 RepID=A0ABU8WL09_9BURK